MGCDIHTCIERKWDGDWRNAGDAKLGRSYSLFAFLADVRNSMGITPICQPRGLPDDASFEVQDLWKAWDDDKHTPSWVSLAELKAHRPAPNAPYAGMLEALIAEMERAKRNDNGDDDIRLVFWFDN